MAFHVFMVRAHSEFIERFSKDQFIFHPRKMFSSLLRMLPKSLTTGQESTIRYRKNLSTFTPALFGYKSIVDNYSNCQESLIPVFDAMDTSKFVILAIVMCHLFLGDKDCLYSLSFLLIISQFRMRDRGKI